MKIKSFNIIILISIIILSVISGPIGLSLAEERRGAYLDEIIFIHYLDEQVAVREVQAGNLHTYFWRIPLGIAEQLKTDPNVFVYEAPGGILSLLLNPAPVKGELNPFSIKEVRYAINYLINREYIVNEILRGYGDIMVACYGPYDPDYLVVVDLLETLNIRYNPELASKLITDALLKAGAKKVDGKWFYDGKPITLKFFIRSDDPRRKSIGEVLVSELEKMGFTIDKIFGDLAKATSIIYGSDPKDAEWHLYTEGWGRSAFVKYDSVVVSQFYSPWFGYMPGYGEPTYWNYKHDELDSITKRITTGNFSSKDERDSLIRRAVALGIDESVRIFIASSIDPYIISKGVIGVVNDFGAGITNRWSLVNMRIGEAVGKSLKVGMKQIYQNSWNPVRGMTDWYATRIWYGVYDPATWTNPHTGDVIPVRAEWKVETAGPKGRLKVPSDAIVWDPYADKWKSVGDGVTATSKVTFKLKYSNWHHGQPMAMSDLLYSIYFFFEWGTKERDDDPTFDPEYTSQAEPIVKTNKGIRFIDKDTVEVYVDYWHFDDNYIADYASVWSSTPWELMAAMEKVVLSKEAAFSRSASKAANVPWLCQLIKSNAEMIKKKLIEFNNEGLIPEPLKNHVSLSEARRRYEAAISWIDRYGHAVISNGPYYLDSYNPDARTIVVKVFKDPTYPFELGTWKHFQILKVAKVKKVEVPTVITTDKPTTIRVSIDVGGEPSHDAEVNYRIIDPEGKTVEKGNAKPSEPIGTFTIDLPKELTSKLKVGSYTLRLFAISKKAIKPDIYETSFIVGEAPKPSPTPSPTPTPIPIPSPSPSPSPSPTPTPAPPVVGPEVIISIVISMVLVVSITLLMRRKLYRSKI
ncbi:MAG: ABC transporter substrate-binding protein [Nitrososphaerales archaeon]|nr:ABC transporter substrate-binding protein [Nitrososphaerales archaeon]